MSEYMLIHYRPHCASHMCYWALGGDQHPSITLGHGALDELPAIARNKKVTLIIDSVFTTVMSLNIPSKNRSKQLQAIPFAMEDHLAEDIEDTHFAIGKADQQNMIPVVAINRERLKNILAEFSSREIHIDYLITDSSALPIKDNSWSLLTDDNSVLIKTTTGDAQSCELENLQPIFTALLEQSLNKPESIQCFYSEEHKQPLEFLDTLDIEISYQPLKSHPLEVFAGQLRKAQEFNLLQGEFAVKRKTTNSWLQAWKPAAIAASVWVVLYLTFAGIQSQQLEAKNLELSKHIEAEFKRAMPEARTLSNMQKRVERHLRDLKTGGGADNNNVFLHILSKATPALSQSDKVTLNSAVFRNNSIDLDISSNSLQNIEMVKSRLLKIPELKTVLSTTVEKDKVNARLRLEAKG